MFHRWLQPLPVAMQQKGIYEQWMQRLTGILLVSKTGQSAVPEKYAITEREMHREKIGKPGEEKGRGRRRGSKETSGMHRGRLTTECLADSCKASTHRMISSMLRPTEAG